MSDTFCCPITLQIMDDPVCDKEGNSFEKSAIVDWITRHGSSPITRTPMTLADLIPNRKLKDMILEYLNKPAQPKQVPLNDPTQIEADKIELHACVDNSQLLITVDPGDSQVRTFLNVCCVIDVSGSMGAAAAVPGEDKEKRESFGLTILDIVKHAVTTIFKSLNANDRLAIVTFSDRAEIILPLTCMDETGQSMAAAGVRSLHPQASTNLWAGLEKGLDILNAVKGDDSRLSTVMLFTDGEANIIPPRGHLPMLQMYKDKHGGELPGSVHTFGFGYDVQSDLLNELAVECNGGYSFIPDSGFVGTVFVHAIANLKVTIATSCRLSIELLNGTTCVDPMRDLGQYLTSDETWGLTVDIGSLQTGQVKEILLELRDPPPTGTTVAFINLNAKTRTTDAYKLVAECNTYQSNDRFVPTYFRFKFIQTVKDAMKAMQSEDEPSMALVLVGRLIKEMKDSCSDPQSLALLEDIQGQVVEGLQLGAYKKWGCHYLPSLLCAHLYQVCNNFKDVGPQVYGGTLFKSLRDEADELFCSLPPPEPSQISKSSFPMQAVNMRSFHSSRNVCFHGDGLVRMFDGSTKEIKSIAKGDQILSKNENPATVVCVVESKNAEHTIELVEHQNGLLITPWHPIRLSPSEDWIFPISVGKSKLVTDVSSVYNFVLDAHHVVNVNDIDCVTLGHSLADSVCAHDYFGSDKVVNDLKKMRGYGKGLVQLIGVHRDPITSLVNGLIEG